MLRIEYSILFHSQNLLGQLVSFLRGCQGTKPKLFPLSFHKQTYKYLHPPLFLSQNPILHFTQNSLPTKPLHPTQLPPSHLIYHQFPLKDFPYHISPKVSPSPAPLPFKTSSSSIPPELLVYQPRPTPCNLALIAPTHIVGGPSLRSHRVRRPSGYENWFSQWKPRFIIEFTCCLFIRSNSIVTLSSAIWLLSR